MKLEICSPEPGKEYQWAYRDKYAPGAIQLTAQYFATVVDFENRYGSYRFTPLGVLADTARRPEDFQIWVWRITPTYEIVRVRIPKDTRGGAKEFATFQAAKQSLVEYFNSQVLALEHDLQDVRNRLKDTRDLSESEVTTQSN